MKYIVSNKIDAPASHLIALYAIRWRVETFFNLDLWHAIRAAILEQFHVPDSRLPEHGNEPTEAHGLEL